MMNVAAAQPTTRAVRAAAQLAATSRTAREEFVRLVPGSVQEDAFWDDMMERILARGARMAGIGARFAVVLRPVGEDGEEGPGGEEPEAWRLDVLKNEMEMSLRASRADLADGFVARALWHPNGALRGVYVEHPFLVLGGADPVPLDRVLVALYEHPGFQAQDAAWRGAFLVSLVAGLAHGLAKAAYLRKHQWAEAVRLLGDAAWDDEDEADEALESAQESLAAESAAAVAADPAGVAAGFGTWRARLLAALRAAAPRAA